MSRRYGRVTTWTVALGGLCVVAVVAWGLVAVLAVSPPAAPHAAAVHRAVVAGAPSVTFVGDSWTEGVGATRMRGYAVLTCEQLGWECHVLGVGGAATPGGARMRTAARSGSGSTARWRRIPT